MMKISIALEMSKTVRSNALEFSKARRAEQPIKCKNGIARNL